MTTQNKGANIMTQYLLGRLPGEEKSALEQRFFENDEFFEQMKMAEEELIEDYVAGALAPEDARRFQERFMATQEQRERVELVKMLWQEAHKEPALAAEAAKAKPRLAGVLHSIWQSVQRLFDLHHPAWAYRLALVALLLILLPLSWLFYSRGQHFQHQLAIVKEERANLLNELRQLGNQVAAQNARLSDLQEQIQTEQSRVAELEKEPAAHDQPLLAALDFEPGSFETQTRRSESESVTPILRLTQATALVRLRLAIPDESYGALQATLETLEGREIMRQTGLQILRSNHKMVALFVVPTMLLEHGDYLVRLQSAEVEGEFEDLSSFWLTVEKK